jgi:NADH-quinone oxidoreductase subunit H
VISQAQQGGIQNWFWFHDPFIFVAGIIFFIASLAAAKRAPFDLPEAESELVSGFHTEYSGFQFLLRQVPRPDQHGVAFNFCF